MLAAYLLFLLASMLLSSRALRIVATYGKVLLLLLSDNNFILTLIFFYLTLLFYIEYTRIIIFYQPSRFSFE